MAFAKCLSLRFAACKTISVECNHCQNIPSVLQCTYGNWSSFSQPNDYLLAAGSGFVDRWINVLQWEKTLLHNDANLVPFDQQSENESPGSIHYRHALQYAKDADWDCAVSRITRIWLFAIVISKWMLPELSFSDRWSRERDCNAARCHAEVIARSVSFSFGWLLLFK